MPTQPKIETIINSLAPIRICDNGGWTDTWFAGHGNIFNIGVAPYAEVQVAVQKENQVENRIVIHAENYGDIYRVDPKRSLASKNWVKHPLIEASIEYMDLPEDLAFKVNIFSKAPAGASTGTSAAVTVALLGALDALTPGRMTPHEVALAAQKVETKILGQQCGIQDQLCSAYGGINYIEMTQYPKASITPIQIPDETWWELERRLFLIYLGNSHKSSEIHDMVIHSLEDAGPNCPELNNLRKTASRSRDALLAGDFEGLGNAMTDNNKAQRQLHPALISEDVQKVIDIANEYGALGWKVNGAGGEGGSLTLLGSARSDKNRAMVKTIEGENPTFKHIPTNISRFGLRVWTS